MLVRFKTARMRGEVKRRIVVYSNDMDHNAVSLSVTAHIKPELQVEPARLEIVPPPEGGERRVELELANLSNRDLKQLSARTTVKGLEAEGEVQRTLAPGEKTVLSYSIKFPSHEDAARNVRSGYIIVEARGYGRSRERIPVLIQNSFQQD